MAILNFAELITDHCADPSPPRCLSSASSRRTVARMLSSRSAALLRVLGSAQHVDRPDMAGNHLLLYRSRRVSGVGDEPVSRISVRPA